MFSVDEHIPPSRRLYLGDLADMRVSLALLIAVHGAMAAQPNFLILFVVRLSPIMLARPTESITPCTIFHRQYSMVTLYTHRSPQRHHMLAYRQLYL